MKKRLSKKKTLFRKKRNVLFTLLVILLICIFFIFYIRSSENKSLLFLENSEYNLQEDKYFPLKLSKNQQFFLSGFKLDNEPISELFIESSLIESDFTLYVLPEENYDTFGEMKTFSFDSKEIRVKVFKKTRNDFFVLFLPDIQKRKIFFQKMERNGFIFFSDNSGSVLDKDFSFFYLEDIEFSQYFSFGFWSERNYLIDIEVLPNESEISFHFYNEELMQEILTENQIEEMKLNSQIYLDSVNLKGIGVPLGFKNIEAISCIARKYIPEQADLVIYLPASVVKEHMDFIIRFDEKGDEEIGINYK